LVSKMSILLSPATNNFDLELPPLSIDILRKLGAFGFQSKSQRLKLSLSRSTSRLVVQCHEGIRLGRVLVFVLSRCRVVNRDLSKNEARLCKHVAIHVSATDHGGHRRKHATNRIHTG